MGILSKIKPAIEAVLHPNLMIPLNNKKGGAKIVLALAPDYLNYGDHAIALAELNFFRQHFPGMPVVELPLGFMPHWPVQCNTVIGENDIIVITGGGFLGDLWLEHHEMTEHFLQQYPNNTVIFAPNTVYWTDENKERAQHFADLLNTHKHAYLCVREENSYNRMREFGYESILMPDFVFLWKRDAQQVATDGSIALCLRADREGIISAEQVREICNKNASGRPIRSITMAVDHVEIPAWIRSAMVARKFKEFASADLVITDRLHGMIFSTLSGTPCIALDNASHKVSGVYQWIQELPYVKLVEDPREIPERIEELLGIDRNRNLTQLQQLQQRFDVQYSEKFAQLFR